MQRYSLTRNAALYASQLYSALAWPSPAHAAPPHGYATHLVLGLTPYQTDPIRPMSVNWVGAYSPAKPTFLGYRVRTFNLLGKRERNAWPSRPQGIAFPTLQKRVALPTRETPEPTDSRPYVRTPRCKRDSRENTTPREVFGGWLRREANRAVSGGNGEALDSILLGHPEADEIRAVLSVPVDLHDSIVSVTVEDSDDGEDRTQRYGLAPADPHTVDYQSHGLFDCHRLTHWQGKRLSAALFAAHVAEQHLFRSVFGLPRRAGGSETAPSRLRVKRASHYKPSGPVSWEERVAAAKTRHAAKRAAQ